MSEIKELSHVRNADVVEEETKENETIGGERITRKTIAFESKDVIRMFHANCRILREKHRTGWSGIIAGSIRRGASQVHDLDAVLVIDEPILTDRVKQFWESVKEKESWIHQDYRVCPRSRLGAMLLYLTGDRDHNISMRAKAARMGMTLNEYGLWGHSIRQHEPILLAGATERQIYKRLNLAYLSPSERTFRILKQDTLAVEV